MLNFDNICRTCSLQGELQSLFIEDLINPAEMLTEIVDIKVIKGDRYPQNICTRCLDTLKSAYLFKNQCQNSYKKFEQYLSFNSEAESIIDCKEEANTVFIKEEKQSDHSEVDDDWFELGNEFKDNPEEKPYEYETCDVKFENQKKYDRHLKKHKQLYICPICGEQFPSQYPLKKHSIKHSEVKPYTCEKCNAQFKYQKNYKSHLKKHEQSYMCSVCGNQFPSKKRLEQHSREHFNNESFIDKYCEKSYIQSPVTLKIENEEKCKSQSPETISTKVAIKKKYLCDYCGREYNDASKLNDHIRTHTGEKPYSCNKCNKFFTSKKLMRHHDRIHHTKEKRYKCNFCEKTFSTSKTLKCHLRIHTNDKPFTCDICNQKFRIKHHLIRHQFVHTGEKPFSCTVCNKKFTQNSNLRSHMRTHTSEKSYACSMCSEVFHDLSSMKNHRAKHVLQ